MKRVLLLLPVCLLPVAVACGGGDDGGDGPPTGTASGVPATTGAMETESPTGGAATETAGPTGDPLAGVCGENPDPANDEQVVIESPEPGEVVEGPLTVQGLIAAFEAQFNVAVKRADGSEIVSGSALAEEGQTLAPFSVTLGFGVAEDTPACVWVYTLSPMDGSVQDVAQIPVLLRP